MISREKRRPPYLLKGRKKMSEPVSVYSGKVARESCYLLKKEEGAQKQLPQERLSL